MKQYKIALTRQAREHILEYARYIRYELMNSIASDAFIRKIYDEIGTLDQMPARYPLTDEDLWHTEGIHKMLVRGYIVYYDVDESQAFVRILAAVYGRQDQATALADIMNN